MRALVAVGRIEAPFVDAAVRRQAGPFGTVGSRTITERAETVPAEEEHAPGAHREHDPGDLARPVEELIRLVPAGQLRVLLRIINQRGRRYRIFRADVGGIEGEGRRAERRATDHAKAA